MEFAPAAFASVELLSAVCEGSLLCHHHALHYQTELAFLPFDFEFPHFPVLARQTFGLFRLKLWDGVYELFGARPEETGQIYFPKLAALTRGVPGGSLSGSLWFFGRTHTFTPDV